MFSLFQFRCAFVNVIAKPQSAHFTNPEKMLSYFFSTLRVFFLLVIKRCTNSHSSGSMIGSCIPSTTNVPDDCTGFLFSLFSEIFGRFYPRTAPL